MLIVREFFQLSLHGEDAGFGEDQAGSGQQQFAGELVRRLSVAWDQHLIDVVINYASLHTLVDDQN